MNANMRIAVAGATGRVGKHVVDLLERARHDVVAIARSRGVDVISGEGLAGALTGVECIVDTTTGPSPEERAATEFFTTAARNLHEEGSAAGVDRMVVVSIIGCDRFTGGYNAAKVAHERAALAGPIPARILRAAQFHEFVGQLLDWGTRGEVGYVPEMRTQLWPRGPSPRRSPNSPSRRRRPTARSTRSQARAQERLVEMAQLLAAERGAPARVEEAGDPADPDRELFATGGLLPGPHATLAGPTFEAWLRDG